MFCFVFLLLFLPPCELDCASLHKLSFKNNIPFLCCSIWAWLPLSHEEFPAWDFYHVDSNKLAMLQNNAKLWWKMEAKKPVPLAGERLDACSSACSSACHPLWIECRGVETAHWARMFAIHSGQNAAAICPQLTATAVICSSSLLQPTNPLEPVETLPLNPLCALALQQPSAEVDWKIIISLNTYVLPPTPPKKSSEDEHEAIFCPHLTQKTQRLCLHSKECVPLKCHALTRECMGSLHKANIVPLPRWNAHGDVAGQEKKNRPALWLRQLLADWTCVSRTQMTNKTTFS